MKFLGADLVMIQIAGVFWANGWSDFYFFIFDATYRSDRWTD